MKIHDSTSFKLIKELKEEKGTVVYAIKPFNNLLYSGSYKALKVWDLTNYTLVYKVALPGVTIYSIALYSRNIFVANDKIIYVSLLFYNRIL